MSGSLLLVNEVALVIDMIMGQCPTHTAKLVAKHGAKFRFLTHIFSPFTHLFLSLLKGLS